jgi:hypothetical protein
MGYLPSDCPNQQYQALKHFLQVIFMQFIAKAHKNTAKSA